MTSDGKVSLKVVGWGWGDTKYLTKVSGPIVDDRQVRVGVLNPLLDASLFHRNVVGEGNRGHL